jgi:CDP-glycerol glycerophosphotransferase
VLATQEEVVDAIRTIDADRVRFADRYREWQQRFNPHDDGHVAERIITRLLARS